MTPQEFKEIWENEVDKLSPLHSSRLSGLNLSLTTIDFLISAGLPVEAAPFLTFAKDSDDEFEGISKLVTQYGEVLDPEFERYIVIGSCCDGDLIAVNTDENDKIEWLDHRDLLSPSYFNKSIYALADFLVFYRDFIKTIQKENGEHAYLDANFSDHQLEALKQKMILSDSAALSEEGFWKQELELLLANREDYLQNK